MKAINQEMGHDVPTAAEQKMIDAVFTKVALKCKMDNDQYIMDCFFAAIKAIDQAKVDAFLDDIRKIEELASIPMAEQVKEVLHEEVDPDKYHLEYREGFCNTSPLEEGDNGCMGVYIDSPVHQVDGYNMPIKKIA